MDITSNTARRPHGLGILVFADILLAIILFIPLYRTIIESFSENGLSNTVAFGIAFAILLVAIAISAYGTWVGNKFPRITLLLSLTILTALMIEENVHTLSFVLSLVSEGKMRWSILALWDISSGIRWLFWLAFHYWYLLKINRIKS